MLDGLLLLNSEDNSLTCLGKSLSIRLSGNRIPYCHSHWSELSQMNRYSNIVFCDDSQLSYDQFQTKFTDGQGLSFDDAYRLAHLPLVAPDHPLVIAKKPGSSYNRGVHDLVYSIAIPIDTDELLSSKAFIKLYTELNTANFSHKLSWENFAQRKNKLHATICSAISTKQAPKIEQRVYQQLRAIGPVSIRVRGLFSGNVNIGRLYLKVYPELRDGTNMCHEIQTIFNSPATDLYVVGLFNFVEELNSSEAQELSDILVLWRDVDIILSRFENLWLLKSRDDLVLDGGIEQLISMV